MYHARPTTPLYTLAVMSIILLPARLQPLLMQTGGELTGFLDFVKVVGLPVAMALIILWAGSRGWWYYGQATRDHMVEIKAQYEARILAYETRITDLLQQNKAWQEIANTDAQTSKEALRLTQEMKATMERMERELRALRPPKGA